ncbi:retrovirus-related pol polyprotein from transposon TNT 1-94 [Tanacetum coccineum]
MTGNKSYLFDYEEIDGGFVAFGGVPKGGRITSKGKISTGKLDFEDVYFVKELKFNIFSVSQICDKKNSVLFTDTECVVLSHDFKLLDENHVLLKVPRKDNMYSVDLKNIVLSGGLTCLFAKATLDESNIWHRRLRHINFKTMNKLVRGNLVRGLPSKIFENNHTCVACQKGKQHKASCIENLIDLKVKVIRCDNGTEFKNKVMNQFCEIKAFWAEAVNTACYVQNRVLVIKPQNKTPYERFLGRKPALNFTRPFGCPVTILNTLDHLGQAGKKIVPDQEYILLPLLTSDPSLSKSLKDSPDAGFKPLGEEEKMDAEHPKNESKVSNIKEPRVNQEQDESINNINTISSTINTASIEDNIVDKNVVYGCIDDPNMPNLEEIVYFNDDEEVGAEADMNNLATTMPVSPIPTIRVHKDHPLEQIIRDRHSRAIGTKWVYRNKKDDRGIVVRNKVRLVAQGYTQEEDGCKECIFYGTIKEEVYVCQPPWFEDPEFPNKVYKVEKDLYGLHQALKAWYETLSTYLLENGFRRGTIDKTLFIKKDKDDAQEIPDEFYGGAHFLLRVFDFATVKTTSTPMETNKSLLKDEEAADVDVHLYRSMIGSLMYLTASRLDIMFSVCACARFQVTPKTSHLHAVKRIFRYLKGNLQQEVVNFSKEDLCHGNVKKQTIVANSTTEAEYVDVANCCGQVLWIQNQLLDYGYNFMNTKIFIDNESTISIVKNPVFHSRTKHIEIRHHFIRDSYDNRLIQVIKIHTNHNVANLLTKAFDVSRFQYLITNETVIKEWEDIMERAATTIFSLEAEQDGGNINRTRSMATLNESLP